VFCEYVKREEVLLLKPSNRSEQFSRRVEIDVARTGFRKWLLIVGFISGESFDLRDKWRVGNPVARSDPNENPLFWTQAGKMMWTGSGWVNRDGHSIGEGNDAPNAALRRRNIPLEFEGFAFWAGEQCIDIHTLQCSARKDCRVTNRLRRSAHERRLLGSAGVPCPACSGGRSRCTSVVVGC
jgi:hypothetical protein